MPQGDYPTILPVDTAIVLCLDSELSTYAPKGRGMQHEKIGGAVDIEIDSSGGSQWTV